MTTINFNNHNNNNNNNKNHNNMKITYQSSKDKKATRNQVEICSKKSSDYGSLNRPNTYKHSSMQVRKKTKWALNNYGEEKAKVMLKKKTNQPWLYALP